MTVPRGGDNCSHGLRFAGAQHVQAGRPMAAAPSTVGVGMGMGDFAWAAVQGQMSTNLGEGAAQRPS